MWSFLLDHKSSSWDNSDKGIFSKLSASHFSKELESNFFFFHEIENSQKNSKSWLETSIGSSTSRVCRRFLTVLEGALENLEALSRLSLFLFYRFGFGEKNLFLIVLSKEILQKMSLRLFANVFLSTLLSSQGDHPSIPQKILIFDIFKFYVIW